MFNTNAYEMYQLGHVNLREDDVAALRELVEDGARNNNRLRLLCTFLEENSKIVILVD